MQKILPSWVFRAILEPFGKLHREFDEPVTFGKLLI